LIIGRAGGVTAFDSAVRNRGNTTGRLILALALPACLALGAEDWSQFRGPGGEGHSSAKGLPLEWSESLNIAWKTPIAGVGWSSTAIRSDLIWLTTATEEGRSLRAVSIDRKTGRTVTDVEVFRLTGDIPIHAKNSQRSDERTFVSTAGRHSCNERFQAAIEGFCLCGLHPQQDLGQEPSLWETFFEQKVAELWEPWMPAVGNVGTQGWIPAR
jgi:hypothetical protein